MKKEISTDEDQDKSDIFAVSLVLLIGIVVGLIVFIIIRLMR